jgi:hypothetical protein
VHPCALTQGCAPITRARSTHLAPAASLGPDPSWRRASSGVAEVFARVSHGSDDAACANADADADASPSPPPPALPLHHSSPAEHLHAALLAQHNGDAQAAEANLPKQFDWRNRNGKNFLGPVRNQVRGVN